MLGRFGACQAQPSAQGSLLNPYGVSALLLQVLARFHFAGGKLKRGRHGSSWCLCLVIDDAKKQLFERHLKWISDAYLHWNHVGKQDYGLENCAVMSVIDQPSAQASNMSVIDHQPRPRSVANFFRQNNYDNYVSSRLLEPGFVRKSILHEVATDWLWSMARMGCCHESIRWISRLLSPNLGPIDFKLHRCKISDKPNHCTLMSATRCKLPWKMLSMNWRGSGPFEVRSWTCHTVLTKNLLERTHQPLIDLCILGNAWMSW